MDIDTPGGGAGATDPGDPSGAFSLVYPLPFRILSLISLGVLAWATNLHGATAMGIDAGKVLDVRIDDLDPQAETLLPRTAQAKLGFSGGSGVGDYLHPSRLYPPAYQLFAALSLWTLLGWSIFHCFTLADPAAVSRWTVFPFLWASVALFFLLSPWTSFLRRERTMALRSFKRIALEGLTAPVPFCDVLMADVMTSFAKVMGDCWVSACLAFVAERGLASQVSDLRCYKEVMVPFMTSLPYIFRLRQCLAEYFGRHTATPRRSLLNALKYATAFPVIILSALQNVYGDPYVDLQTEATDAGASPALGSFRGGFSPQQALFQIWVLAVFVNSLYSFWWDVTNDWGLSLLLPSTWPSASPTSSSSRRGSRSRRGPIRLPSPSPSSHRPAASLDPSSSTAASGPMRHSPPNLSTGPRWTGSQAPETMHRTRSASVQIPLSLTPEIGSPGAFDAQPTFPPVAPPRSPPAQLRHPQPLPSSRHHHHHRSFYLPHAHTRRHSIVNLGSLTQDSPYLRPTLLLPDPLLYWIAIAVDLLLRFTWSLKLSSHLHEIHEIESGVFAMEALEVARRWMWTFLRIEWEAVKKSGEGGTVPSTVAGIMATGAGEDIDMASTGTRSGEFERTGLEASSFLAVGPTGDPIKVDYETDDSMVVVSERAGLGLSGLRDKGDV